MATLTRDELLSAFKEMSLLELSDFVKKFEDTFGVTATTPVVPPPPPSGPAPTDTAVEEPAEFTVVLESSGDKKIQVIREVRILTKLGLKEAKDFVDSLPKTVVENVSREDAAKVKAALEAAGGVVTVK